MGLHPPRRLAALTPLLLAAVLAAAQPALAEDAPKLPEGMQEYLDASKPIWAGDADLLRAVADGGANWKELAKALDEAAADKDSARLPDTVWIIKKAPHLDRLELSSGLLQSNYYQASSQAIGLDQDHRGEFFRRYILNYRLDDEPVTDWRAELASRYMPTLVTAWTSQGGSEAQLAVAAKLVCKDFKVLERGFYGNLADPVSIDNSRAGTKREFALLTAAVFRSLGVGTRFVRDNRSGESWVEVYWDKQGMTMGSQPDSLYVVPLVSTPDEGTTEDQHFWLPVYPTAPEHSGDFSYAATLCGGRLSVVTAGDAFGREQVTARYGPTARIRPVFLRDNAEVSHDGWTLSAWNDGAWVPLDDLEYPASDKGYPLDEPTPDANNAVWYTVGAPGRYMLTCGVRYPGGVTQVQTAVMDVAPDDHAEHYFGLDAPAGLPDSALLDRQIADPLPLSNLLQAQGRYLFLIVDDNEPSKRAETLLEPLKTMNSLNYQTYRADSTDPAVQALLADALKYDKADPLPVLVLIVDGKARLYLRGYNLNALEWVQRELAK